jgi:uracil-DNA glycosylase family protein
VTSIRSRVKAQASPSGASTKRTRAERKPARSDGDAHPADVPATRDLDEVRDAARSCTACPLYRNATQTVFGEGPKRAEIVFIGEQPGDQEDLEGRPFVGPAGKLLNRALEAAGVDRTKCYVTNAVKHFKWEPRGKRRLHQKPNEIEVAACRPWWVAEVSILKPRVVVCLGGTAAKAVFRRVVKVMTERGKFLPTEYAERTLVTVHPSSLLRVPDSQGREEAFSKFVADLRLLKKT